MRKILWKEGMFLEPQHFQLSERFLSAGVGRRVDSLAVGGFGYGFTELEIDRDALLCGNFSVLCASGVFPDGSVFCVGRPDPALPFGAPVRGLSRSFAPHCRADQRTLDVYLAVSSDDTVGGRYAEETVSVPDELSAGGEKEIALGVPDYRIVFEGEPLDGCDYLIAARLTRNGSGYMEVTRGHAPPVLFTRTSAALRERLGGLIELLWARMASLAKCRGHTDGGQALFSAAEIYPFYLLNTLCAHAPLLSRLAEHPKIHPFDIYTRLTALFGALQSFAPEITLDKFPPYDHCDPAASFTALADGIRAALKTEFWAGTAALDLERVNRTTWACRFPSERFARSVNLFIGVRAEAPQKALLLQVLQRMKVCSREKLDVLVSSSMPGLPLIHVKSVPEGLAAKPDYLYFAADRQSRHWEGIEASGTLGIHFPAEYQDIKLELLALRHDK